MIVGTAANNLVILLINFATSILAARLLGVDGRGQLALVLLYPQLIAAMGLLGLDRGIAITGGQKRLNCPTISITVLAVVLTAPVMIISSYMIIREITDPLLEKLSLLYMLYIPALYLFMFSSSLFNGIGMFFEYNISRLSFYGSYFVLIIVFWMSDISLLNSFIYASLLSVYVVMFVSIIFQIKARSQGEIEERNWKLANIVKDLIVIFKKSSVFIIPGILLVLSARLDQVIVSNYLELKYLGLFVVYVAFSQLLAPIANAINVNVFHLGIKNPGDDIGKVNRLTIFIYMVGSVLLALLAPFLINLLYGESYLEHVSSARLLVLSAFLFFSTKAINEFMMGKSMVLQDVTANVIFIAAMIWCVYLFIPALSITEVAISMVAANFLRFLYLILVFRRLSGRKISEFLLVRLTDIRWVVFSVRRALRRKYEISD